MYATHVLEAVENYTPRLEDFHVLQEFRSVEKSAKVGEFAYTLAEFGKFH